MFEFSSESIRVIRLSEGPLSLQDTMAQRRRKYKRLIFRLKGKAFVISCELARQFTKIEEIS